MLRHTVRQKRSADKSISFFVIQSESLYWGAQLLNDLHFTSRIMSTFGHNGFRTIPLTHCKTQWLQRQC